MTWPNPDLRRKLERQVRALAASMLPIGRERQYWAASALATKDEEITEAETRARVPALAACREIVQRYGGPVGT